MENTANPDSNRKAAVGDWQKIGLVDVSVSNQVENIAITFAQIGIKPMDALYGNFGISLALLGYSPCFLLDSNRLQVKDVLLSIYVTLPQPLSPQFLTGNFGFGSPHELLRLNKS
jgi:hypothetical protein